MNQNISSQQKLTITKKVETIASFRGLPVKGSIELLTQATSFLSVNWEGEVNQVFIGSEISRIHDSFFEPSDKAGLAIFGVNSKGEVIFGMAKYVHGVDKDHEAQYFVQAAKSTETHPW